MPVVPSKQSKRTSKTSGKRECKKGRCLIDEKCEDVCESTPPISFPEEPLELVYPDELPSQPDFQPVENEPQPLPTEAAFPSIILENLAEDIIEEVVPVLARVVSECGTKVFNQVTRRWVKIGGKAAAKAGL